jgi:hypothetical protein
LMTFADRSRGVDNRRSVDRSGDQTLSGNGIG